ncbi:hypothetical protein [Treponema vincentii]|uniref:hypothetical protein n=1 Tax=Treponema vincentii TaxID=69710 RepID=UPI003D9126C1
MASFGETETSLLLNTSGIRAATDNPQRISPPWMAVVPCSNAICEMQIAQVNNVQGCTLFTVPPVGIC